MKTNATDFKFFKRRVNYWIRLFGLLDWNPVFIHKDLGDDPDLCGALAGMTADPPHRIATFYFNIDRGEDDLSEDAIDYDARHEVLHLLHYDFDALARSRFVSISELDRLEHAMIARIENFLNGVKL